MTFQKILDSGLTPLIRGSRIAHGNAKQQDFPIWQRSSDLRTGLNFPLIFLAFLYFKHFELCPKAWFKFGRKSLANSANHALPTTIVSPEITPLNTVPPSKKQVTLSLSPKRNAAIPAHHVPVWPLLLTQSKSTENHPFPSSHSANASKVMMSRPFLFHLPGLFAPYVEICVGDAPGPNPAATPV